MDATSGCARLAGEEGSSPVTAIAGVTMFLAFLLLAAQTTIHLYGVSTSTAVMFDEARRVAAARLDGSYDCEEAEAAVRSRLGGWGARLTVTCRAGTDDLVEVQVVGPSPAALVAGFGSAAGLSTFARTVRVRAERFQS